MIGEGFLNLPSWQNLMGKIEKNICPTFHWQCKKRNWVSWNWEEKKRNCSDVARESGAKIIIRLFLPPFIIPVFVSLIFVWLGIFLFPCQTDLIEICKLMLVSKTVSNRQNKITVCIIILMTPKKIDDCMWMIISPKKIAVVKAKTSKYCQLVHHILSRLLAWWLKAMPSERFRVQIQVHCYSVTNYKVI